MSEHKMDADTLREYLDVAVNLSRSAGLMMTQTSGRNTKVEQKSSFADLVTETDKAIEEFVFSELRRQYPNHRFVGEESTTSKVDWTNDPTWIIDPIDGTMNFYHQFPFCCISIGLTINKEIVMGVVYSPFLDKLYTAAKGTVFGLFVAQINPNLIAI
jgi:fructose-1,6-bisphosphatase/inositol monophosphatase family enzyme